MKKRLYLQNESLHPMWLHMIFCSTILVLGFIGAYLYCCGKDGFLSYTEKSTAAEYFFVCITEIMFISLSVDLMYKYEKSKENEIK